MSIYMFTDTETGGVDPKWNPLMSAAFIISDNDYTMDSYYDFVREHSSHLEITKEALAINKIDLKEYKKHAVSPEIMYDNLLDTIEDLNLNSKDITIVGHRINFDLDFLNQIHPERNFRKDFNRIVHDTAVIADFIGIKFTNLKDLGKQLGVEVKPELLHTAYGDALLTKLVYFKLKGYIK